MPKHAKNANDNTSSSTGERSSTINYDAGDNRIGLTEAFAPIDSDDFLISAESDNNTTKAASGAERTTKAAHASGNSKPTSSSSTGGKHGKHGAQKEELSPAMRHSKRMRRVLIIVIVLLIIALIAIGFFVWQWIQEGQTAATQQAEQQQSDQEAGALSDGDMTDSGSTASRTTEVPDLMVLFGTTQDEAIEELAHGATVASTTESDDEDNPIKTTLTISLLTERTDTSSNAPSVFLGLNEDGKVIQVGYSVAISELGYGSISFSDAIENDNIIEETLNEAGLDVPVGIAVLPEDRSEYSTYASDDTTLMKESYTFDGEIDVDDASYAWTGILTYDYSSSNTTENLADTIRTIYIYIDKV